MSKCLIFWILLGFAQSMFGNMHCDGAETENSIQNIRNIQMIDVLKLLKKEFKIQEHVVIIHDDTTSGEGKLHYGRLHTIEENRCVVGGKEFDWKHIIFMSHDGFPCRTLNINLSLEQLDKIDNEEALFLMRKVLVDTEPEPKPRIKTKTIVRTEVRAVPRYGCGGGCPFIFDDVQMQILNSGLIAPRFVEAFQEEALVMTARDGAKGFMWNIDNEIFDFWKN